MLGSWPANPRDRWPSVSPACVRRKARGAHLRNMTSPRRGNSNVAARQCRGATDRARGRDGEAVDARLRRVVVSVDVLVRDVELEGDVDVTEADREADEPAP